MPSTTPKQQHFFQMVKGIQMGKLKTADLPAGVREKLKKTAKTISPKAAGEFAAKVEEGDNIDFSVLSFKEYMFAESALIEALSELTEDDVIELNELSKVTLKSYVKKAMNPSSEKSVSNLASLAAHKLASGDEDSGEADDRKAVVRSKGVIRAANKLSEAWKEEVVVNPSKKGMFKDKTVTELESELVRLKKSGPHKEGSPEFTKEKEINFALRAKSGWKGT
jgi:hypothetical protein